MTTSRHAVWGDKAVLVAAALAVVVLTLLQDPRIFFPGLGDLSLWDEAKYMNFGRELAEKGVLCKIAWGPVLALFHAVIYIGLNAGDAWMQAGTTVARLVLGFLLCLTVMRMFPSVSRELKPWHAAFPILAVPVLDTLMGNSSDALFTVLSCAVLTIVLRFVKDRELRILPIAIASFLVGCAALVRPDGFPLFAVFVLLVYLFAGRGQRIRCLISAVTPFALLVVVAYIVSGETRGQYMVGLRDRSYIAFRQGHLFIYGDKFRYYWEADADFERVYGGYEKNRGTILLGVMHNPGAMARRVARHVVFQLPGAIRRAYGPFVLIVLALACRGAVALYRKGERRTLLVLLAWVSPLLAYLATFYREGYLLFAFPIVAALAAEGAHACFHHADRLREKVFGIAVGAVVVFQGICERSLVAVLGGSVVLASVAFFSLGLPAKSRRMALLFPAAALALLLACLRISERDRPPLNTASAETVYRVLLTSFPPGSRIVAPFPGIVWAARREFILHPVVHDTSEASRWLENNPVEGVVIYEPHAPGPCLRDALRGRAGVFDLLYSGDGYEVYRRADPPGAKQPG
ncbi:MAG: hypothetical protein QHI48_03270 [Bacteroidota bacterium]|nr:hypothetical protein [Bacteroidota bacterium]